MYIYTKMLQNQSAVWCRVSNHNNEAHAHIQRMADEIRSNDLRATGQQRDCGTPTLDILAKPKSDRQQLLAEHTYTQTIYIHTH